MKKVLFISTTSSVMHSALLKALKTAGFEVHFVDFRSHSVLRIDNPIHRLIGKMPAGIRNYFYGRANSTVSRMVLEKAQEIKPDYIFASKAKSITIPVLEELRKIAPTINWYPDAANNWPSIRKLVSHYDYFFIFDRSVVEILKKEGHSNVYYLPFSGDMDKSDQWPDKRDYKYKVIFLGSYNSRDYQKRLEILMQIKDLGLEIWGNRDWLDTPLKDSYHGPVAPDLGVIKNLYADSKIVIHIDANTGNAGVSGLTMRPFDVTSAGSMLIAQDDRSEIFDMFKDGEEFISFHDENDIRGKVEYYLSHEDERKKIAQAGFVRTRTEHTYLDRVKKIFETVSK